MAFAFLFFDSVGGGEWLVLLAVVLIVVGPKNLPAAARKMGQILSQLRRAADEFKRQIMTMDQEMEKAVSNMKQDYIDIAKDVDAAVAGDTAPEESPSADPGDDGRDRAYDYYGEDGYGEDGYGDMGEYHSDEGPSLEDAPSGDEAPAATGSPPAEGTQVAATDGAMKGSDSDATAHQ